MVQSKSYTPTNKRFKRYFQDIAATKKKKGHLSQAEREQEDVVAEKGELKRIIKAKFKEDGWVVDVGTGDNKKTYNCVNGTGEWNIPESIESNLYYTPKEVTVVDVLLDNVSKIYTITRIRSLDKTIITNPNQVKIGLPGNDENKDITQIILENQHITLNKQVKVDGDIEAKNISALEKKVEDLEALVRPVITEDELDFLRKLMEKEKG